MKVKLVSYSQPSAEFLAESGGMNTLQDLIAYAARVSNPTNQLNTNTAPKLINYLIRNKHWSPLEMVSATLEIETTRDIGRQILRHRSFSFQEFSQRYADPTNMEFDVREARLQDQKNRQNSIETDDVNLSLEWRAKQLDLSKMAMDTYGWAIGKGIAKEQARAVLPEGCTMSRMYMSGTLRSWVFYIQLRTEAGTQKEHREVALACAAALTPIFPLIQEFVSGNELGL
jgi:thymidylate synthase (FAD)